MKKLLTLVLALLMVVGLSAPAMAFTSDTEKDDDSVPYDLKIYLVDYEDNDLFGLATLPESDRGYAKNEIVAAVVELYVPEDETVGFPDNSNLKFGGENVDLDVADNYSGGVISLTTTSNVVEIPAVGGNVATLPVLVDDEIRIMIDGSLDGEDTYKWLFFAKVTGDDASLYAELKDGIFPDFEFPAQGPAFPITLNGIDYMISKAVDFDGNDNIRYTIVVSDIDSDYNNCVFFIDVDENYKSEGMTIGVPPHPLAALGVNTDGELGVIDPANPAKILTDGDLYDDVMDFYNDVVVDVFGMDYMLIGNYVRDSYFEDLVSPKTLIATVDIEPWTAYVTVPDNIVVDPPKTGDAASIMGFVMVALSGAGVVALRKRG